MRLVKLNSLFDVYYGVNLDLNKLDEVESTHINAIRYVGRSEKNNGVTAFVLKDSKYKPNPPMTISVAGGGSVMSSFLQENEYYSGRDLFYLKPKVEMSKNQLIFYCAALRLNKFKFSYGRQANKSLENLLIPDYKHLPHFIKNELEFESYSNETSKLINKTLEYGLSYEKYETLSNIFHIKNGVSSDSVVVQPERTKDYLIPYIRPSKWQSTSYAGFVDKRYIKKEKIFPPETLYISTDGAGSHTYSYVSVDEFVPNSNVVVLIPKKEMSLEIKLAYATYITANRFKFSYGRKPKGKRLKDLMLPNITP